MRARWTSGTKTVRTWAAALCALLALFLTLPALADAASIIVRFDLAGHPRQDQYGDSVQIGLYRAGRYEDGAFFMEPPYDQVDLTDIRSALQADMALAEMGRLTEGVSPDASGTLSGGSVTFSGLTPGVYYGKKIGGPSEFGMDPFFVLLTSSVTVQPKWSEVTSARLVKIWDDAQDQDGRRPDSISARLYADGQLLDTYTLTAPEGAGKDQDWIIEVSGLNGGRPSPPFGRDIPPGRTRPPRLRTTCGSPPSPITTPPRPPPPRSKRSGRTTPTGTPSGRTASR